ncbi:MAG: alpha/beta hydrolase [Rudaea sp.]
MSAGASTFPIGTATFTLAGPAGSIECASETPPPETARPCSAILCHPHPLQGGAMTNKVVTTLARALRELGVATLRFNFRGVGASAGAFDDGTGETDDLLAVAAWLRAARPHDALWLGGFSFGSYVATRASAQLPTRQLITIAPAVTRCDFATLSPPPCPWLIVQGEADEVVDPAAVYAFAATRQPPPDLVRLADTGHFFHGRLVELRALVQEHVRANLPDTAPA